MKFINNKCILNLHNKLELEGVRVNNIYMINLDNLDSSLDMCLKNTLYESKDWHKRLCHIGNHTLKKITHFDLIRLVPKLEYSEDHLCNACMNDKQTKFFFKYAPKNSMSHLLEVLHMDLFRYISTTSSKGKSHDLVIVNDYTIFIWIRFF